MQNKECQYIYMEEGIHRITFITPTTTALDQCFIYLDHIFAQAAPDKTILILSDVRQSGIPIVPQVWTFSRQLLERHPNPPPAKNAIVHNSGVLVRALMTVVGQLAVLFGAKARFFPADQYDAAVSWLLEK